MGKTPCSVVVATVDESTWSGSSFWIMDQTELDLEWLIFALLIFDFKVNFCSKITLIMERDLVSVEIQLP